ncbi:MAG: hypothetical protein OEZ13_00515 [Spirochaetia bacterium]|nr:hypothetical protein [Spirochaetia bacterium]
MRTTKKLFVCKKILLSLPFLFFLLFSSHAENNNKNKEEKLTTAESTCEIIASSLGKGEKKRRARIGLKNKIYLCRGTVEKVLEDFSQLPDELISKSRWIAKLKKPYLLILKPESRKLEKVKFYLFSSKEEVAEVLTEGTSIEFSGQLLFEPFLNENIWRMVFINQEAAIKI